MCVETNEFETNGTNNTYTDSRMEIQTVTDTSISFTAMGIPLVTGNVVSVWELNQV